MSQHPNYRVTEGNILIFMVGHFPKQLTAIPLGIFAPDPGSQFLRVGVFNADTFQSETNGLNFHTTIL